MDVISWVGAVSGLVGSVITIVVGMKKFHSCLIIPISSHFNQVNQCFADVAAMKKKLEYELSPNGGNSLKDHVKKYGQQVSRIEGIVLAILSSSDKGVWISDESGNSIWLSDFFDKKLGWSITDMLGNGWKNVVHPDDREAVSREFLNSIKDYRSFIMDYRYVNKNDSSIVMKVHAVCQPIKKNDGEVIGYIGFVTEIKT